MLQAAVAGATMLLLIALLYGPFIDNPAKFDDAYFFVAAQKSVDGPSWPGLLDHRWVSTGTLALTYPFWGEAPAAYNVGNLLLHLLAAFSLFLLIRDLLTATHGEKAGLPAFAAALLFALHPVAAFATGYIVERSIILAAFFSIWMWIAVHRGVAGQSTSWMLVSAVFYYLAVFSKEHAITALPVAILLAWNAASGNQRKAASALAFPLSLWIVTAAVVILRMKGVIGTAYEPLLPDMQIAEDTGTGDFILRSAVNQSWLFFKYALLWLVPSEGWMSIDMREPFPPTWHARPWFLGLLGFVAYPVIIGLTFQRGYLSRLGGIALLSPWLLFLTMFGAVYYQESFVLYRSYLWALPGTWLVALLLAKLPPRAQVAALVIAGLLCFGSTWSRLETFSHPVLVWDEAARRVEGRDGLPGTYRIYYNRGIAYTDLGDIQRALADFDKSAALGPAWPPVYFGRGAARLRLAQYELALSDFNRAIALKPEDPLPYVGRGLSLLKLERINEGLADLAHACQRGVRCKTYKDEVAKVNRQTSFPVDQRD